MLNRDTIIEDIKNTELKLKEFCNLIDEDTIGHIMGLWGWVHYKKDIQDIRQVVSDMILMVDSCASIAKKNVSPSQLEKLSDAQESLKSELEHTLEDFDRLDFLKYCLYYKGEDKSPYKSYSDEDRFWFFEEMYIRMFPTPESRKKWEADVSEDTIYLGDTFLAAFIVNKNVPIQTKGIVEFAIADYLYHTSGLGVEFIYNYGKGKVKDMDKYIYIDGNAYTAEEEYWLNGGNTGMLPQRITPSQVNQLKANEIFVFGSNFQGKHIGGAAKAASKRFGAVFGIGEGLQGQSYAIPTMEGVDNLVPAIERFTSFAKQHKELTFWVTPIGCGIAGYKPEDIAPHFMEAAFLPNVNLPLSFWKRIVAIGIPGDEFEGSLQKIIDVCKHMHRYNCPTWNSKTDEAILNSLDRCYQWQLGLKLNVIDPNEEEPQIKALPKDLRDKILAALIKV